MATTGHGGCPTCGYPSGRCICTYTIPRPTFPKITMPETVRDPDPELRAAVLDLLLALSHDHHDLSAQTADAVERVKKELSK